jgi:two-component system LytT family response regulator
MTRIIIADDEAPARNRLKTLLADHPDMLTVGEADSGDSALTLIMKEKPDGAILDITMPGISVFTALSGMKDPPAVIFLTAHAEFAVDAFTLQAVDYLLKPVGRERFAEAMEKLRKTVPGRTGISGAGSDKGALPDGDFRLTIKTGAVIRVVDPAGLSFVTVKGGFSSLETDEGELCSDQPLSWFEELLEPHGFIKVNRQTLVSKKRVIRIHSRPGDSIVLELKGGVRIPVSRRRAAELRQLFGF